MHFKNGLLLPLQQLFIKPVIGLVLKTRDLLAMSLESLNLKSMMFYNGMPRQDAWIRPPQLYLNAVSRFMEKLEPDGSYPDHINLNSGAFGVAVHYKVVGLDWCCSKHLAPQLWLQLQSTFSPSIVFEFATDENDLPVMSLMHSKCNRKPKMPAIANAGTASTKKKPVAAPKKRPAAAKDSPKKRPAAAKDSTKKRPAAAKNKRSS